MVQKRKIDWKEFQGLVGKICRDISNDSWKPDYVVGITRGGLLPALMISHYFNIPCQTLKVSLRDNYETESNCWMAEEAFGYYEGSDEKYQPSIKRNILIVDDINDTGATINWILNDWRASCLPAHSGWDQVWNNNVRFAVIVDNESSQSEVKMDYCGLEVNKAVNNVWIDFPYEDWWAKYD